MYTLVVFIIVLAVLVVAHEFGHFAVAKKAGVKVEEFGFGFPPRIFGIQRIMDGGVKKYRFVWGNKPLIGQGYNYVESGNTVYSINWLPLGGFVKIKGETGEAAADKDSFSHKKPWVRLLILSAGVGMNILLAAVLLSVGFKIGLPAELDGAAYPHALLRDIRTVIVSVLPDAPAAQIGLREDDIVTGADDLRGVRLEELRSYIQTHAGKTIALHIVRGGVAQDKIITPVILKETGKGGIGVALGETGVVSYSIGWAVIEGFKTAGIFTWEIIKGFGELIAGLFRGAKVAGEVAGPVGIAVLTGKVARMGFTYLLQFMAMLSLNLAVLNIIPFPALDGGRVLFVLIEKARGGRPVDQNLERTIHTVGFALLLLLVVIVTFRDVNGMGAGFAGLWHKIF